METTTQEQNMESEIRAILIARYGFDPGEEAVEAVATSLRSDAQEPEEETTA